MQPKEILRSFFDEAVQSVLPDNLIRDSVRFDGKRLMVQQETINIPTGKPVHVFGSGKASAAMAGALYPILNERIAGGMVLCNVPAPDIGNIQVLESSHPVPTEKTIRSTEQLITAISALDENDFYIYLLSGGSSALVEKPHPPVTLDDLREMTSLLLRSGVPIGEMNIVRKHLSLVKGGRLGQMTRAKGVVLVLSDVIGDDLSAIGSALMYCDSSAYKDVQAIVRKYHLESGLPVRVSGVIKAGLLNQIPDTPKTENPNLRHFIIGNNFKALLRARERAGLLNIPSYIMTSRLCGESREAAKAVVSIGKEILASGHPFTPPVCLIFGGETTVTLRGDGHGGRNQEFCLSALNEIRDCPQIAILSGGTDGIDGRSGAAGAVIDHDTFMKSRSMNLNIDDYLSRNDSYHFFKQTGDLIMTGSTGTNVGDVILMYVSG